MTTNWTNSGDGLWDDAGNWSTGTVPARSTLNVGITASGTYTVLIQQSDPVYTIRSLTIGGDGSNPVLEILGQLDVQKLALFNNQSGLDVGGSGTLNTSRLTVSSGTDVIQGAVNVSGALSGAASFSIEGGDLFASTVSGSNSYVLSDNATFEISNSQSASGSVTFADDSGSTLDLDMAGSSFSAAINGFSGQDTIDIGSLGYSADYSTSYDDGVLSIMDNGTTVFTFSDFSAAGPISLDDDGDGGTELSTTPCFLPGTRILTPDGEVPVEDLRPGDLVLTLADGKLQPQSVIWVGHGRQTPTRRHSGGGHPVRILAHAFATETPRRDLLVTPEHCLFVEGCLVPARMLVNGQSIVEEPIATYGFHHIELDQHAILLAEGLPTESYLDTGNRLGFSRQDPPLPTTVRPRRRWEQDGCAPLVTARTRVEPVWRRLQQRAETLGLPLRTNTDPPAPPVADPEPRVRLDDGRLLAAFDTRHLHHLFHIPTGRRAVALVSGSAVPAEAVGPFVDDRRRLGVQVGRIVWWDGLLDSPLDVASLSGGWHAAEDDGRWTDGHATLDLPAAGHGDCFVEIEIISAFGSAAVIPRTPLAA